MKLLATITILLINLQIVCGQTDTKIEPYYSDLKAQTTLIDASEYNTINSEPFIKPLPLTEQELVRDYPEFFKFTDSCYTFKANANQKMGIKDDTLKACRFSGIPNDKEYSRIEFQGVYCNYALVYVIEFEGWYHYSVDLANGITFSTEGVPLTVNCNTSISYFNYYGLEVITLTDLKSKKQYIVHNDEYTTVESKSIQDTHYLKLQYFPNMQLNSEEQYMYLKIQLK